MKPTYDFDETVLDNADRFAGPFYERFRLRPAPRPLALSETVSKTYLFPTFYGDVTCAQGIFLCSYEKARRLMLHPRIKPVRMPRGRAVVAFSCYEYRQVLGVPPYNEIAMTIPILVDPKLDVPVLPMVADRFFPGFGYYVFSMPVTSLENQIRGVEIWGLPKVVQEIDVVEEGGECVTRAFEENGEKYFELRVPTTGTPTEFDVRSHLYTDLGGRLVRSPTCFKATFQVTKYMGQLLRRGGSPERPVLWLGDTASGRVLRDLEIEEHPFQFRFARGMTSSFDLPDESYEAPFALRVEDASR